MTAPPSKSYKQERLTDWIKEMDTKLTAVSTQPSPTSSQIHDENSTSPIRNKRQFTLVSQSSEESTPTSCNNDVNIRRILSMVENIQHTMNKVSSRLEKMENDMLSIKQEIKRIDEKTTSNDHSIQANSIQITEIAESLQFTDKEVKDIKETLKETNSLPETIEQTAFIVERNSKKQTERIEKMDAYSRRCNLIFEGVAENRSENCAEIINDILAQFLGIINAKIGFDKVHRMGKGGNNPESRPRVIIVKFTKHAYADDVYSRRRYLARSGVWIKRDYPEKTGKEVEILEKIVDMTSTSRDKAILTASNNILYKGEIYDSDTIRKTDIDTRKLHEKENKDKIAFHGKLSPLSNFYRCNFEVRGKRYTSSEQFYQSERARKHHDYDLAGRIRAEDNPYEIKRLAKDIFFDKANKEAEIKTNLHIMEEGLMAKFSVPVLKDILSRTGNKIIYEASRFDKFWGTGIGLYHRQCLSQEPMGENQMGKLLVYVRSKLTK